MAIAIATAALRHECARSTGSIRAERPHPSGSAAKSDSR